jgi:hypothetical protein
MAEDLSAVPVARPEDGSTRTERYVTRDAMDRTSAHARCGEPSPFPRGVTGGS